MHFHRCTCSLAYREIVISLDIYLELLNQIKVPSLLIIYLPLVYYFVHHHPLQLGATAEVAVHAFVYSPPPLAMPPFTSLWRHFLMSLRIFSHLFIQARISRLQTGGVKAIEMHSGLKMSCQSRESIVKKARDG